MGLLPGSIQFVSGSDCQIDLEVTALPQGVTVDAARLVVKHLATDADAAAIFTINIDGSDGKVSNTVATQSALLSFIVNSTNTALLDPTKNYFYFVKCRLSDGRQIRPPGAQGTVTCQVAGITNAV